MCQFQNIPPIQNNNVNPTCMGLKSYMSQSLLKAQMKIYKNMFQDEKSKSYGDIIPFFKKLKPQMRNLLSEVCKVLELILVLPASNAALERSFSRMKNIKTRLRSTMTAKRLNHSGILSRLIQKFYKSVISFWINT